MTYRIGEVARMMEVSVQSLRRWEEQGFILSIHRSPTNRRIYTETDITAIKEYLSTR